MAGLERGCRDRSQPPRSVSVKSTAVTTALHALRSRWLLSFRSCYFGRFLTGGVGRVLL